MTCIIIEDEPLAVKVLSDYISQVPFLALQATYRDAIMATEYLREHKVDLIFLDIHLPKLKGMAFLKTLASPPAIIITTAYHQYAVEAFDLSVTDYLLKPFEFDRFLVAVNKVNLLFKDRNEVLPVAGPKEFMFLNVQKKKVRIMFCDILYVESQREYIRIVTTKSVFVSKISTHEIEALLPASMFRRVHRSFIVAMAKIDSYTSEIIDVGGTSIPIGRGYRDVLDSL